MVPPKTKPDFSGYATKNDLQCSDGRTILRDAFKGNDGQQVPLVWQHLHGEPSNILGHAILENREDGVYAYCYTNDTDDGKDAKKIVQHKDITYMSIFANELVEKTKSVLHGVIREVSLVLAGANPGAKIDNLWALEHADDSEPTLDTEAAIITTGVAIDLPELAHSAVEEVKTPPAKEEVKTEVVAEVKHADPAATSNPDETVEDVINTLTEKQRNIVYALLADAQEAVQPTESTTTATHSTEGESKVMKKNIFDKSDTDVKTGGTLTHAQFDAIKADAIQGGSFKKTYEDILQHTVEYGIENIEVLFPDAKTVMNEPAMISRRMEWVQNVLSKTRHSPFARIKTRAADITADEARARGYVKASRKKDEVIKLLGRTTTPKTIYKKQRLDRDDIIDITDFDVVLWMKAEMRIMLDEELARAILISDGRSAADPDKIDEDHIRPIWTDDELFVYNVQLEDDSDAEDLIEAVIMNREHYNGSGNPTFYTSSAFVGQMLLLKDTNGRRLYETMAALQAVLRVDAIIEVPVMATAERDTDDDVPVHVKLIGIIVNLADYTVGADKGGAVNTFEDFDIDFNQQQYLIETRVSGALTLPQSALVFEKVTAAG